MIYFLAEPGTGNIKIGFTDTEETLERRIKRHQCGNSNDLTLLCLIEGDRHTEARIHRNFKNLHVRGEWFRYTGNLPRYVEGQIASIKTTSSQSVSH